MGLKTAPVLGSLTSKPNSPLAVKRVDVPYGLMTERQFPCHSAGIKELNDRDEKKTTPAQLNEYKALVLSFIKQVGERTRLAEGSTQPEARWVHLKVLKKKRLKPRWTGPFEVVERTSHVVQLKGRGDMVPLQLVHSS